MEITLSTEINAILERWNALQSLQQMDICAAAVRSYNKRLGPNMRKHLRNIEEDLVPETWLEIHNRMDFSRLTAAVEKADREGRRRPSLENLAYNAAAAAVRRYTKDIVEQMDRVDIMDTDEGDMLDPLDMVEDTRYAALGDLICRPTERRAVEHLRVKEFLASRDQMDKDIVYYIGNGYTERETAAWLKTISQQGVNKRRRRLVRDMMEAGIMPSYYPTTI